MKNTTLAILLVATLSLATMKIDPPTIKSIDPPTIMKIDPPTIK